MRTLRLGEMEAGGVSDRSGEENAPQRLGQGIATGPSRQPTEELGAGDPRENEGQ